MPETQALPTQQPPQLLASHGGCAQVRCGEHARVELSQCRHASPFRPHSFGSVPEKQTSPSQHPLQVEASQEATTLPQACRIGSQT
jgi:hypothetical protein